MRFRDPLTRESNMMSIMKMIKETSFGRKLFVAIVDSTAEGDGVILRSAQRTRS
jgi:hypothetical protein